jgi:hypothetical protein
MRKWAISKIGERAGLPLQYSNTKCTPAPMSMKSKSKPHPTLPRNKVLAVVDRAYDRLVIAQNNTELMEALGKLCGELGWFVETYTPEIKAEVGERLLAYRKLQGWESAPNTVQLKSETMVARWPVPRALIMEVCDTLEAILGDPETWKTKLE